MRKLVLGTFLLALVALAPSAVFAVGPTSTTSTGGLHFVGQPDLTVQGGSSGVWLRATGEVAGAGTTATATLSADVEVVRGCINRGSKDQQPSGLQASFGTTSGSTTFHTRSGRGTFTVDTSTITAAPFSCPDQMVPVLVSVKWTNILLTISSAPNKEATASFPDQSWP
jgi:hypothetical protein